MNDEDPRDSIGISMSRAIAEHQDKIIINAARTGSNTGHGHVWERPDGMKARCGGPGMCSLCSADKSRVDAFAVQVSVNPRDTEPLFAEKPKPSPHYITSRAELGSILAKVRDGKMSVEDAYASIDLTLRQSHLSIADWMEQQVKSIRESNQ